MSRIVDVLVVGSGMAGLMAALTAAEQGRSVQLLTTGMGSLAISGGSVDFLGYADGRLAADPWQSLALLPEDHPYRLLGTESVRSAFQFFADVMERQHWPMRPALAQSGAPRNTQLPTIMGTLKPSYLLPASLDAQALTSAKRVLVLSVQGLRDCRTALVVSQLKRYKSWTDREFSQGLLPSPFGETHRAITALDLARLADKPQSRQWLLDALAPHAGKYDLILIPPLCGSKANPETWQAINAAAGCPVVEMLSIPPGVGGLRLRDALLHALHKHNFEMVENTTVLRAEISGKSCTALVAEASGQLRRHAARAFVAATGGILGGGMTLEPGKCWDSVFGIDITVPQDVAQWSEPEIFGSHLFSHMGVRVDREMRPVDAAAAVRWQNVFFAGRSLGGYDYATEKSGHGVAIATGWQAGRMAAAAAGAGENQ
ncbi:anaerobic glycerol-3-phosphate dehydrogenase subunit B [Desulfovibrio desulfuricans]|uniref:Anaerobic glycerol-3-phosphate dehydrogenase subunit B n=1 Tax=Desulfovibrio desulfuricans TaxID=876 RepID=A0A4P7UGV9_DESDE|nr:anaerobic glycerol-3-phosphate dehydrogenase subunit GlpB [Desulfovibrio desulfuricans]QCC85385.1 anaerobic glycerol-3-phosphate dehydrogenase subunit B [Desulfovibrio desulfuricans]